jgi:hypothetical protein
MRAVKEINHSPRFRYDCKRCKFSWCCGIRCACVLRRSEFSNPPKEIQNQVIAERKKLNPHLTLKELREEEFERK